MLNSETKACNMWHLIGHNITKQNFDSQPISHPHTRMLDQCNQACCLSEALTVSQASNRYHSASCGISDITVNLDKLKVICNSISPEGAWKHRKQNIIFLAKNCDLMGVWLTYKWPHQCHHNFFYTTSYCVTGSVHICAFVQTKQEKW